MYVIVAGGGKVGRFLTETLVNDGYEVLLIEKNKAKVERYTEQLGGVVVQGDACEARVLSDAGVGRADIVVAVTGDDEDNLVICQMAKSKFHVARTIARINNPRNEKIFQRLGIDAAVSHTELLLNMIEREIASHPVWNLVRLRQANLELLDVIINSDSPALNKPLSGVHLPPETQVLSVIRGGKVLNPAPNLVLNDQDEILLVVARPQQAELKRALVGA